MNNNIFQCPMCGAYSTFDIHSDFQICQTCEEEIELANNKEEDIECCDNCQYFNRGKEIECEEYASEHKLDKCQISSTDTFRCRLYRPKHKG